MKLGILGGTFDPPHSGHLMISEYVRQELHLDEIWFIPVFQHPLKNSIYAEFEHRYRMTQLLIADHIPFKISEMEKNRKEMSYTVDTLEQIKSGNQNNELFLIMGEDNLVDFSKWKDPERIFRLSQVIVYPRKVNRRIAVEKKFKNKILLLSAPMIEISSSWIRDRIKNGKSAHFFVPAEVEKYIASYHLYES